LWGMSITLIDVVGVLEDKKSCYNPTTFSKQTNTKPGNMHA
jgi:hypothetical protein